MPFTPRIAATIRAALLADWRARYLALSPPQDLAVEEGTPAYNEADAFSKALEPTEYLSGEAAKRVLIRGQFGTDLDQSASDDGTERKAASAGRLTVALTGPLSASTPVSGATLSAASGLRFTPINPVTGATLTAISTDGAGAATVTLEAQTLGTDGTVGAGTVLTWTTAPTGFGATATVATVVVRGENAETDTELQTRLIERRRERPGSGNRSQWCEWGRAVAGVGECFVYPRTRIDGAGEWFYGTPGCLVLEPVTPAPDDDSYVQNGDGTLGAGLDPSTTRIPSAGLLTLVRSYLDGTTDADGDAVPEASQVQLYPATIDPDNVDVRAPAIVAVPVRVRVTTEPAVAPWPWGQSNGSLRNVVSATTTALTLDDVTGIVANKLLAVYVGRPYIRGGWWVSSVTSVVGSVVNLATSLPLAPPAGADVRPDCGLWSAIREVLLKISDGLGPGDARVINEDLSYGAVNAMSTRYPRPPTYNDRVFPSTLVTAIAEIAGVAGVSVELPSGTIIPAPGTLAVLSTIEILIEA
ncbi:MAG: baseplate J/gp47 family protein [Baekduiaceae bacterium]